MSKLRMALIKYKLRSLKSSEHINEKGDGSCVVSRTSRQVVDVARQPHGHDADHMVFAARI